MRGLTLNLPNREKGHFSILRMHEMESGVIGPYLALFVRDSTVPLGIFSRPGVPQDSSQKRLIKNVGLDNVVNVHDLTPSQNMRQISLPAFFAGLPSAYFALNGKSSVR